MIVLTIFVADWEWWWLYWHYMWLTDDDRGDECVDIIRGWLMMTRWWWLYWYFLWLTDDDRGDDCVDIICGWLMMTGVVIVLALFVADW